MCNLLDLDLNLWKIYVLFNDVLFNVVFVNVILGDLYKDGWLWLRAPHDGIVVAAFLPSAGDSHDIPTSFIELVPVEVEDGGVLLVLLEDGGLLLVILDGLHHVTVDQPGHVPSLSLPAAVEPGQMDVVLSERESQNLARPPVPRTPIPPTQKCCRNLQIKILTLHLKRSEKLHQPRQWEIMKNKHTILILKYFSYNWLMCRFTMQCVVIWSIETDCVLPGHRCLSTCNAVSDSIPARVWSKQRNFLERII